MISITKNIWQSRAIYNKNKFIGTQIDYLTIVNYYYSSDLNKYRVLLKCNCGNIIERSIDILRNKRETSYLVKNVS